MDRTQISHSLVKTLRKVPMFEGLDDHDLLHIVGLSANLQWPAEGMVFTDGSAGDALYIVLSGRVRIYATVDGKEIDVASIGPGDFFGELSLMREEPHSKSAQATEQTELMAIPKDSFASLLASDARLRGVVDQRISERLAANDQALNLN
ncbi:MAG: cyclic nucleotide-binding domain-containing protein [Actinomycetota bacterium]|nr:cyclic nucleotide-binding domain-containing protein [Actinomycetota bacterium]